MGEANDPYVTIAADLSFNPSGGILVGEAGQRAETIAVTEVFQSLGRDSGG